MKKTKKVLEEQIKNAGKRRYLETEFSERFAGFKATVDNLDRQGLEALQEVYDKMAMPNYDRDNAVNQAFIDDRIDYLKGKLK